MARENRNHFGDLLEQVDRTERASKRAVEAIHRSALYEERRDRVRAALRAWERTLELLIAYERSKPKDQEGSVDHADGETDGPGVAARE